VARRRISPTGHFALYGRAASPEGPAFFANEQNSYSGRFNWRMPSVLSRSGGSRSLPTATSGSCLGGQTASRELPRCPSYIGGDDVSGVPVQAGARTVVAHRGARVCVRCGLLNVAERDARVERGGDERVPQRVRAGVPGDPRPAGDPADDPGGAVPVQPPPVPARKSGPSVRSPIAGSIARAVRGASGMVTTLPPLRLMTRVRWPRSRPRCSMSAPVASGTRSPLSASREISVCSADGASPAAIRSRCTASITIRACAIPPNVRLLLGLRYRPGAGTDWPVMRVTLGWSPRRGGR